jgi:hypothetical protein
MWKKVDCGLFEVLTKNLYGEILKNNLGFRKNILFQAIRNGTFQAAGRDADQYSNTVTALEDCFM